VRKGFGRQSYDQRLSGGGKDIVNFPLLISSELFAQEHRRQENFFFRAASGAALLRVAMVSVAEESAKQVAQDEQVFVEEYLSPERDTNIAHKRNSHFGIQCLLASLSTAKRLAQVIQERIPRKSMVSVETVPRGTAGEMATASL